MSELSEIERADPFQPHDPGCRCWPHVSQRAAVEAATQAATTEYREGVRVPMTPIPADDPLAALTDAIERAEKEVFRLCSGRDRSFRMTVPPEPDRDSDLLLIAGLDAGREALRRLAALQQPAHPEPCECDEHRDAMYQPVACPMRRDGPDNMCAVCRSHKVAALRADSHVGGGLDERLTDALIATLRRDDLCDDTEGEHHTDDYIAAFLIGLDTELQARAALSKEQGRSPEGEG